MISVGIVGASGYSGAELLRLCAGHPQFDVRLATADSKAGAPVAELYPNLAAAYGAATFQPYDPAAAAGLDVVFLALPHGASQSVVPELLGEVGTVVDLGSDYRLRDPGLYPTWYGAEHTSPHLLQEAVYGLPELFREDLPGARLVAAPGCYVTAATLALAPLLQADVVAGTGIVVDAASGVSGAGRGPKESTSFCAADENLTAYGLLDHRHTPEIEQVLGQVAGTAAAGTGAQVLFTPHLAPMSRGILATCYARPAGPAAQVTTEDLLTLLRQRWKDEAFVVVTEGSPATGATTGSNVVQVTAVADPRTGWIVAISALDNLVKGAAGQAVQCANLATGLAEDAGLTAVGVYP